MGKYSQRSKEYTTKYVKENLDVVVIRVPKGHKEHYKEAAQALGLSLNKFAIMSMDHEIENMEAESKLS